MALQVANSGSYKRQPATTLLLALLPQCCSRWQSQDFRITTFSRSCVPIYPATCRKINCNKVLSIKHLHIGTILCDSPHDVSQPREFCSWTHQPTVFTWITPNPRCFSGLHLTSDYPRQGSFLIFNVLFSYHWSRRQSTKLALLYDIV